MFHNSCKTTVSVLSEEVATLKKGNLKIFAVEIEKLSKGLMNRIDNKCQKYEFKINHLSYEVEMLKRRLTLHNISFEESNEDNDQLPLMVTPPHVPRNLKKPQLFELDQNNPSKNEIIYENEPVKTQQTEACEIFGQSQSLQTVNGSTSETSDSITQFPMHSTTTQTYDVFESNLLESPENLKRRNFDEHIVDTSKELQTSTTETLKNTTDLIQPVGLSKYPELEESKKGENDTGTEENEVGNNVKVDTQTETKEVSNSTDFIQPVDTSKDPKLQESNRGENDAGKDAKNIEVSTNESNKEKDAVDLLHLKQISRNEESSEEKDRAHTSKQYSETGKEIKIGNGNDAINLQKGQNLQQSKNKVNKQAERIQCKECNCIFNSNDHYQNHTLKKHAKKTNIECKFCFRFISDEKQFQNHILKYHVR